MVMKRYIQILTASVAAIVVASVISCNKNTAVPGGNEETDIIETGTTDGLNVTDCSFCILSPSLGSEYVSEVTTRFKGGQTTAQNADILFIGREDLKSENVMEAYKNGKTIAVVSPQIELLNNFFKENNIPLLPDKNAGNLAIAAFNKAGDIFTTDYSQSSGICCSAINSLAKWATYTGINSSDDITIDSNELLQATHIYNSWNQALTNELVQKRDNHEHRLSGNGYFEQYYSIIPLHSFDNNKGDFYLIDATFSVALKDMYKGIVSTKFGKNTYKASAFFLKGFNVKIELIDNNGNAVNPKFYNAPQPATMTGSTSYSSGITWSLNATLAGNKSGGNLTVTGGASYNTSKSHTVQDVMIASAAGEGKVNYSIDIKNLPSKPVAPPLVATNTLDFHCGWVWYVDSANDNDTTTYYRIKVNVDNLVYASKGDVEQGNFKREHPFSNEFYFNLPQPNRIPGGYVKLYNSINDSYMTNICFTNAKDSSKVYRDMSGSVYTKSEYYEACLPEGEYNLEFYIGNTKHTSASIGTFNIVRAETLTLQSGVYR